MATPWGGIEMQVEIEFNRHGATPGLDRYHLHFGCFTAWEFERTKAEPAPSRRLSARLAGSVTWRAQFTGRARQLACSVVHVAVRVCYRDFSVPERVLDHHVVVEGHERKRPSVLPRIIVRELCVLKTTKAPVM